jgi:hypothetical protein
VLVLLERLRSQPGETDPRIQYSSYEEGNPRWQGIAAALRRIAGVLRERRVPLLVLSSGPDDAPHM